MEIKGMSDKRQTENPGHNNKKYNISIILYLLRTLTYTLTNDLSCYIIHNAYTYVIQLNCNLYIYYKYVILISCKN